MAGKAEQAQAFCADVESEPGMRGTRTISVGQWQVMAQQREEIGLWLSRLKVEMDGSSRGLALQQRFEDLAREYHEIELLMAN